MQTGFYTKEGALYCDALRVVSLLDRGLETPFYLYSNSQLQRNYSLYEDAVHGLSSTVGYAIKANHNLFLCQALARLGAGAVVVSVDELSLALKAGFSPEKIWMHGNGKRPKDIRAALQYNILLSADSLFDLEHIQTAAKNLNVRADVILRVNPDIDPGVHPYISTGIKESKFGLSTKEVSSISKDQYPDLNIRGVHCHLGSSLTESKPFVEATLLSLEITKELTAHGFSIDTLDIGGGLAIDYERKEKPLPTPKEMLSPVYQALKESGLRILLEPGRSLVGNVGALISRVIGVKRAEEKNFLVVDASMAQLVRPALYEAYHQVVPLLSCEQPEELFDVVGPVCESGDFLAKDRRLRPPQEGEGIAVLDAGAYGFAMSSRYNLQLFCAEYIVDGERTVLTRRAERFEDLYAQFTEEEI